MSKLDLSDAFRHVLVRRKDWELLGSKWQVDINSTLTTAYFVDAFLPFGLRSSFSLSLKYVNILSFTMRDRGATIWMISGSAAPLTQTSVIKPTSISCSILVQF